MNAAKYLFFDLSTSTHEILLYTKQMGILIAQKAAKIRSVSNKSDKKLVNSENSLY